MGKYGKMMAKAPIAAVLLALNAAPSFAAEKIVPEDNDATYELPMYIPKVIQEKMVYFGEDDVGNDELYTMEEPKPKAPAEDNDSSYTLPGEYSPTRNKIKPQITKPAPVRTPAQVPVQAQPAAPQPTYQQPQPTYQQPAAAPQPQQYYQQQPVAQQPAQQPIAQPAQQRAAQPPSNSYYYQQYDYYDQNDNVSPSHGTTNYPSYYQ